MGAFISSESPAEKKAGPGLKGNVKKNNYPKNVYLNSTLGFEQENTPLEAYLRYLLVMNANNLQLNKMGNKLQVIENNLMKKMRKKHPMAQLYGIPPGTDMHYVRLWMKVIDRYGLPVVVANYSKGFDKETIQAYNVENNGKMKKIKKKINAI